MIFLFARADGNKHSKQKLISLLGLLKVIVFLSILIFQNIFANDLESIVKILNDTKINVVAPGSGLSKKDLAKLKNSNLNLNFDDKCCNSSSFFHSADDELRFKCLKRAIYDKEVEVIWSLRGGYGSSKLIQKLMKLPPPKEQKIFIGYSDITAVHLFLNQKWGWKTIHGPCLYELLINQKDVSSILKLANFIKYRKKAITIQNIISMNDMARDNNGISGVLVGGNLTTITTTLGTDWSIKTQGKIFFLEDTNVKPYQIDRLLNHLNQAKVCQNVKAIIFGNFNQDDKSTLGVLQRFANEVKTPVFKTNKFGHGKFNDPIICNSASMISPSKKKGYFNLIMNW